ncbi:RNI-like protein [Gigaspora margarita]|uniref:RNI-like protein n=1 Tax=Gigaspora margarita TaxID=4874 RepID=A0A8H4EMG2_GIGMA|nr:RNI-like protein [Gigaspora margarita]
MTDSPILGLTTKKFQSVLPFPRKVFGNDVMSFTFAGVGLVPNVSLNVIKLESSIAQNDLNNDDDGPPPNLLQQLPPLIPTQPGNPANGFTPIPTQPGIPINAPPLVHGFRLTNNQPILQQQDSDNDFDDEEKRQRIAEAVQARVHADNSVNDSQHVKHGIKREVKTLKSRCAYCVAVFLTTATSMRTLQSLSNVSADVGELLVNELIKLEKLDVLTFKRFTNCNLQNIILDNYFKASDSLLEIISDTQSSSVTKVSLRNCELITDNGFDCLQDCAFASTLEDLNLSYCSGVGGKTVFADLQPLQNLRRLNLDSVQLTPPLVPVKPSSFRNLEVLDLSRTRFCDQDVMKIICQCKNMIELILIETSSNLLINFPNREEELDDKLQDFSGLRDLTHLSLNKTRIKNASLSTIRKSTFANRKLKYLDVGYTRVTDKGVKELRGLPHLSFLNLDFTQVSLSCRNILADIPSLQPVRLNGITKEVCDDEYYDV